MRSTWITRPHFDGSLVTLEALDPQQHREGLVNAGSDASIWTFLRFAPGDTPAGMDAHIAELIRRRDAGSEVPYIVRRNSDTSIVGVTRFIELRPEHRGLELATWLHPSAQGQGVNPEVKLLMLTHAFADLGCLRVQIKTDASNAVARRSLEALGAVYEGTLRNHLLTPTGRVRDSAFYSIIATEWPDIKIQLHARIARKQRGSP
jgi:RimJ/RimL family protein N-acetyltransferase